MATRVIERPPQFNFSKNEIRYIFQTDDLATQTNVYVQIQLYYSLNFTTPVLLGTFNLQPLASGLTYFYANAYLDSLLQFDLPVNGSPVTPATEQHLQTYVYFREINDANPAPVFINTESSHIRTVIKGGIEKQKWSRDNFFVNYVATQKPFFTWQPNEKYVQYDEAVYLTVFLQDSTISTKALQVVAYDKTGHSVTSYSNLNGSNAFLYHLNISPSFLGLANNLYCYQVAVVDQAAHTTYYTEQRQFYYDYRPLYITYDLLFMNSLGGVDTLRVRGDTTKSYNADYIDADGGLNVSDWSSTVKPADRLQAGKYREDHFKADAGWCVDESAQDRLLELLMSPAIYMYKDSRYVPLIHITKSNDLRNASDKKFSFPLEWQIAINHEVFTPDDVNLGIITTDTETYA
jgi:hypothetical protein